MFILITYLKLASWFEFSLRNGYFSDTSYGAYFTSTGIMFSAMYFLACFVVTKRNVHLQAERYFGKVERIGLLILVLIQTLLAISFYVLSLVIKDWDNGANLYGAAIICNCLLAVGVVAYNYNKMDTIDFNQGVPRNNLREFSVDLLSKVEYYLILAASFIIIGCSATFEFSIIQITYSIGSPDSDTNLEDLFFLIRIFTMISSGLISGAFWKHGMHQIVLLLVLSSLLGLIGLIFSTLADSIGVGMLTTAVVLIAINNGVFWVAVPQLIIRYGQIDQFGTHYGLSLLSNVFGILCFGYLFDIYYNWEGNWATLCDDGNKCFLGAILTFIGFYVIAIGLSIFAYVLIRNVVIDSDLDNFEPGKYYL